MDSKLEVPTENVHYDYFACSAIIALMFIPLTNTGNILRILIVLFLLFLKTVKNGLRFRFVKEINEIIALMIGGTLLSIIFVFLIDGMWSVSLLQHELSRLGFNILLILLIPTLKIPFNFIFKTGLAVLIFHLGIQIMQKTGLFNINEWIRQVYVDPNVSWSHLELSEYEGSSFRSGSIFLNPNVYMVIPCLVLGLILQKNVLKRERQNYVFCLMVLVSLFLTGSRTTVIVFAAIMMYWFSIPSVKIQEKVTAVLVAIFFLVGLIITGDDSVSSARVFDLVSSIDGSLMDKILNLIIYLNSANVIYYLFGSMGSLNVTDVQVDSEWGFIIRFYGLVGVIWYYKLIFQNPNRHDSSLSFFYKIARITILLVAITATVFFCMPIFPYACLLTLADMDIGTLKDNETIAKI
ncbi:MAG: hypothetical protein J5858_03155 [Lentisphaeria bacterium]|nr:hypothetical protein [Lentisphaeria bacterium]